MDDFDVVEAGSQIVSFISKNAPANGVVLGVSGGVDSALVLALCTEALGKNKVTAMLMPESATDLGDTIIRYVDQLGVKCETIPIEPIVEAYIRHAAIADERTVKGNLKARIRMSLLYSRSNAHGLAVMGTGNRSELLIGYFTRYGDGGVDYLPIGDLYKYQVNQLAKHMGVPDTIITQPPSAGLWSGQTDEQELGITYKKLDSILKEYVDKGIAFNDIDLPDITRAEVKNVQKRVEQNSFKPLAPKVCRLKK